MTTKRQPRHRPLLPKITAEAVRLFVTCRSMDESDDEDAQPQRNELAVRLHRLLGRKPWEPCVLDVHKEPIPPDEVGTKSWHSAWAARRALEEAAEAAKAAERPQPRRRRSAAAARPREAE
jgi:hypothetical protein